MTITIETMRDRWADPDARPLFKGDFISEDGRCCAQGDALRCAGWTDDQLRDVTPASADREVARILDISVGHAALLRRVNDSEGGRPERCIMAERVAEYGKELLGPMHAELFAFFRRIDSATGEQWRRAEAARGAAWAAARGAAWAAARGAAWAAVWDAAAWDAAWDAVRGAARDAAMALVVRDLIGKHGFEQDHYDALTRHLREAGIVVHPDDAELMKGGE